MTHSITESIFHAVMPSPTKNQLRRIASSYLSTWNFLNCVGAIDGKHVQIKVPKTANVHFSITEVVDAECKFIAVDVGYYRRKAKVKIFLKNKLRDSI